MAARRPISSSAATPASPVTKLMFASAVVFGDGFSPAEAEQATGLRFNEVHERGRVYHERGRFKGEPWPFGHAVLEPPPEVEGDEKLSWLLSAVLPHAETLRHLGVTYGKVHVAYAHDGQCNLDYEPSVVAELARLGWNFCVSCYEDEDEFPEP